MAASLDRARALLALAVSSTNEEEARTSALAAAKLIQKEGFVLDVNPDKIDSGFDPPWDQLFAAVDPEKQSTVLFCHALNWTPTELNAIAKHGKKLSDQKLLRLVDFCQRNRLPFPLPSHHPGWIRLAEMHESRTKAIGARKVTVRHGTVIDQVVDKIATEFTMADVINIFKK